MTNVPAGNKQKLRLNILCVSKLFDYKKEKKGFKAIVNMLHQSNGYFQRNFAIPIFVVLQRSFAW